MSHNNNNNNNNLRNELDLKTQSPNRSSMSPPVHQSPVSVSVTNSALTSNNATPALSDIPIMDHSEVNNTTPHFTIQGTDTASKSDPIIPNSDVMDVDHEETVEKSTTTKNEDPEQSRLRILDEIDTKLDSMEDTRLEMVPLLLDIIEQVKTGEISIKDVDNVCGRIRLRLNRLREDRSAVEMELENINSQFRCSADQNESTKQRIAIKEQCITNIIKSIDSYKMNKSNSI